MASSKSIISVAIIGDAKKLIGAIGDANTASGGLLKSAAKIGVASVGVKKGFDLIGDSLQESDRLGDAVQRLNNQIGKTDTAKLEATADNFSNIGGSAQDMLELEAAYADLLTSAGVADPLIASTAENMAAAALAAAQVHDSDPSAVLDAIGKAIGGQTRGLKEYGIDVTEAAVAQRALKDTGKDLPGQLTDGEKAAARQAIIMEALAPLLAQVSLGSGDLAQKQDAMGAKFETVGGKIGAVAEGPVTFFLDVINNIIDDIPQLETDVANMADAVVTAFEDMLTPIARVADAIRTVISLFDNGQRAFQTSTGRTPRGSPGSGSGSTDRSISDAQRRQQERNGLGT